jgi:hypothetical protein
MSNLVNPHGSKELKPLLLQGKERKDELKKAEGLKKVPMTSRETSDLIMMGIGAFTPLDGFMGHDDWKGVCESFQMPTKGNCSGRYLLPFPPNSFSPTPLGKERRSSSGIPRPSPIWGQ